MFTPQLQVSDIICVFYIIVCMNVLRTHAYSLLFTGVYIDVEQFTPAVAKNASTAAEGLCTYVRAMKYYHEAR